MGIFVVALIGVFLNLSNLRPDGWIYALLTVVDLGLLLMLWFFLFKKKEEKRAISDSHEAIGNDKTQ